MGPGESCRPRETGNNQEVEMSSPALWWRAVVSAYPRPRQTDKQADSGSHSLTEDDGLVGTAVVMSAQLVQRTPVAAPDTADAGQTSEKHHRSASPDHMTDGRVTGASGPTGNSGSVCSQCHNRRRSCCWWRWSRDQTPVRRGGSCDLEGDSCWVRSWLHLSLHLVDSPRSVCMGCSSSGAGD